MVRESRIKYINFPEDFSGTNAGSIFSATTTDTIYTTTPINGEILEVNWNFNRAGSMFLSFSGTGEEFWRRNAPSGATVQAGIPTRFGQLTTGSVTAASQFPFVANDVIAIDLGSVLSGTAAFDLNIKYR